MPTRRPLLRGLAAACACAVVGAPGLAGAHTSSSQRIQCPVDGTALDVTVTMSMTTFGSTRDFEKKGAIGSYYADLVHACPSCRFAGSLDDFGKPIAPATKAWILGTVKPKWAGKTPTEAEECELAADRIAFEKGKPEPIASLHLIASYFLRKATGPGLAKRKKHQRIAADHFLKALATGDVDADERGAVTYLVGELERRLGNHAAAIRHYDAAAADPKIAPGLRAWITEQRALAAKGDANNDV